MLQFSKARLLLITLPALFSFPAWPETYSDHRPPITVSVYNDAGVPVQVLAQAERKAGRIFAQAGVDVLWTNCSLPQASIAADGCTRFDWPEHLALRIRPHSIASPAEVFGVAFLSSDGTGCYSDVFYDQATDLHADWNVGMTDILGSVVAHELGHLLLGSNSHSRAGIMRAHWQGEELHRLARGNLGFTTEQADRMRGKLREAGPELTASSSY